MREVEPRARRRREEREGGEEGRKGELERFDALLRDHISRPANLVQRQKFRVQEEIWRS